MPYHVIRRIRMAHCKRGPERCAKCRAGDVERICLLDVEVPVSGRVQRRVIALTLDGEDVWREFDVVRSFDSAAEALSFAEASGIDDVRLD